MSAPTNILPTLPPDQSGAPSDYFGPSNFTWMVRGRLAGMAQPGLSGSVGEDVASLIRMGVDVIVTLTDEWTPPAEMTKADGVEVIYLPIPDMQPPTMEQANAICADVADRLSRGHSVVFHCRAGRGRTGTLVASMLIWYRPDFEEAVRSARLKNSNWIESETQMEFLKEFANERRKQLGRISNALLANEGQGEDRNQGWKIKNIFQRQRGLPEDGQSDIAPTYGKEDLMSLDKALQKTMESVPECLASGYVDMDTGMLLGIYSVDSHPQEVLDVLAAATADLFQGSNIVAIENLFKNSRGTKNDDSHYFHEMLVFSENLLHVFIRTKRYPEHVCCFVCRKSANPGMVLTKARQGMTGVTEAV